MASEQPKPKWPRIGVILTADARAAMIADPAGALLLEEGRYFNADKIDDQRSPYFLELTVTPTAPELMGVPVVISIPRHFVLCMVSGEGTKVLGFRSGGGPRPSN